MKEMSDEEMNAVSSLFENMVDVTNYSPYPGIGWLFNGASFSPPPGVVNSSMKITKLAFVNRLTAAEFSTLIAFSRGSGAYNLAVDAALRRQALATYIDLSLQETISGVQSLAALGLLTNERVSIILNTPPTESERYKGQI
jgi:hypothetical protein